MYAGTEKCQYKGGKHPCLNHASFKAGNELLCPLHSKNITHRMELPKKPMALKAEETELLYKDLLKQAKHHPRGQLAIFHLSPGKLVKPPPGFFGVMPQYKAKVNNESASAIILLTALSELSPMHLGPINNNEPGYPDAVANIENYHQFSAVYPNEMEEGKPKPSFYKLKLEGYKYAVPHKYKFGETKKEHLASMGMKETENPHCYVMSVHNDPNNGKERQFTPLESRCLYCMHYEHLARRTIEYEELVKFSKEHSIAVGTFDAVDYVAPTDHEEVQKDILKWYKDDKKPFTHELALFTMLCFERHDLPKRLLPWRLQIRSLDLESWFDHLVK